MNSNSLSRHSGVGRNPAKLSPREADNIVLALSRYAGVCFLDWIPACAGMTGFAMCLDGRSGLNRGFA
jgi:hypothetical protein